MRSIASIFALPLLLTKGLLPMLKASSGQVVFVNSTAGLAAGADNGLYAATKHGLRSLTGSIRDTVNPYGIRVLSVFPGRTATPMQEGVARVEQSHTGPRNCFSRTMSQRWWWRHSGCPGLRR